MPQNKLQVKDKETLRFFPLEKLGDCFSFLMHNNGQKIKFYNKYDYVPCGTLFSLNCPFCKHPDEQIRKLKSVKFMVVNTIMNSNLTLNDRICYVELKYSMYTQLDNWEKLSGKSIYLRPVGITRRGSNPDDTVYQVSVSDYNTDKKITEDGAKMINVLRDEIYDHYHEIAKDIKNIFKSALMNGEAPEKDKVILDGTEF